MKYTTFSLCVYIFLFFPNQIFSQPININTAKKVGINYLASLKNTKLKSGSINQATRQINVKTATSSSSDTLYYVLNDTINHNFVIVAADERSWPILGYSQNGNYDENNQPPAFKFCMENRKKELEYIKEQKLQTDNLIKESWKNLTSGNDEILKTSVEPLLKTQ